MNIPGLLLLHLSLNLVLPRSTIFQSFAVDGAIVRGALETDSIATIEIGYESGIYFTYPMTSVNLIMQPCDSLSPVDDWFCPEPVYSRNWRVGEWKATELHPGFTVYFSPGPSADPEFILVNTNGRRLAAISALSLRINVDLNMYSSGHTNSMFDKKRMYTIQKDSVREIKQAFYHVGLSGRLLRDLVLFSDEDLREMQQTIHMGEEVEILSALPAKEEELYEHTYILKTTSGLLGYFRIENEDTFGALLKGFYFAGD